MGFVGIFGVVVFVVFGVGVFFFFEVIFYFGFIFLGLGFWVVW